MIVENQRIVNTNIQLFEFDGTVTVRTAPTPEGEPVVCAADLARAVGIRNVSQALDVIDQEFKVICSTYTLGGSQQMIYLTEPGVYQFLAGVRLRRQSPYYEKIKMFRTWVFKEVLPSLRKTGSYTLDQPDQDTRQEPALQLADKRQAFEECLGIAKLFGYEGNQALLTANKGLINNLGCDLIQEFNIQLVAPVKETLLTPTQISKLLKSRVGIASAQWVNQRLNELGFQRHFDKAWHMTDKGKPHGEYLDVGKQYSNGTAIKQIKWYERVIGMVYDLHMEKQQ